MAEEYTDICRVGERAMVTELSGAILVIDRDQIIYETFECSSVVGLARNKITGMYLSSRDTQLPSISTQHVEPFSVRLGSRPRSIFFIVICTTISPAPQDE